MQRFLVKKQLIQVVTKSILVEAKDSQEAAARALDNEDYEVQARWDEAGYESLASKEKVLDVSHFGSIAVDDD